eukprot:MONOS_5467.1-p1 / transcript=MONOS_5467.1 / gene=MONOS_5467 / organism=Monocercomonoides_exilis_PA203 / gene_product=unspecified product / transcript_product=unspecified product / location=Mono_scaffold00159:45167-47076(-) / protein_length=469 / sequence_SO=supercontig / SO=protein_coding / is_pseudo=false
MSELITDRCTTISHYSITEKSLFLYLQSTKLLACGLMFFYDCKNFAEIYKDDITKKFTDCGKVSQKHYIIELNRLIEEMDEEELKSIFTIELLDTIYRMIEEKKLSVENVIALLKQAGYCKMLKKFFLCSFDESLLSKRMSGMIIDENEKKEGKNERLLVDLCECYLFLCCYCPSQLSSICLPHILKAALNKEENEEAQKEVEMALLTLSNIGFCEVPKELYISEIKEIIKYHQEHHNLTQLASLSAWQFLLRRLCHDNSLMGVIVNELHYVREATRELEELRECVDWKRKEGINGMKESKEELILIRWMYTLDNYLHSCKSWNEEFAKLIGSVAQILRTAKDNFGEICDICIECFDNSARNKSVEIEHFLKSCAIDVIFEVIVQSNIDLQRILNCLSFLKKLCKRLKEKKASERDESKRKEVKRKLFEKLEECGYEDCIIGFSCYSVKIGLASVCMRKRAEGYLICC